MEENKEQIIDVNQTSNEKAEVVSIADLNKIGGMIETSLQSIMNILRFTKEKDANTMALSRQLQQYRDGIESVLLKRYALEVIGYREDCRKSLRDLNEISIENAKKYIGFLVQDYEDLLVNLGIEGTEQACTINGKKIMSEGAISYRDLPTMEEISISPLMISDLDSLAAYLTACEDAIRIIAAHNTALDCVLSDYIAASSLYEQGVWGVVLFPIVRKLLWYKSKISALADEKIEGLREDNALQSYVDVLNFAIEVCDNILERCNIVIDCGESNVYDSKRYRILKLIPTEDPTLNGWIVNRYTDCYIMDEKTIYPSKVDVYKLK